MALNLTAGAISYAGWQRRGPKPVLQITSIRNVGVANTENYELILSDGSFLLPAVLVSQHNQMVRSRQFQKGSIIQLLRYDPNQYTDVSTPMTIRDLNVILANSNIIGDPKPSHPMLLYMQYMHWKMPRLSETAGSVYNPIFFAVNEESEQLAKDSPNSKKLKTSRSSSQKGQCASAPNINQGKTAIELIDLEEDIKTKAPANLIDEKRGPTIDECYDKLKGLALEPTDPVFLAAFGIFSQHNNYRESWMALPSDPEVLARWITMMAKMLGM